MKCEEAQKLLSAYQDARLNPDEEHRMKSHLKTCLACQQADQAFSKVWSLLNLLEPIEPSSDFKARFWKRVREEEDELQKSSWKRFIRLWQEHLDLARPVFALASLILVTLLGTVVALKFVPEGSNYVQQKSPIIQWTESGPQNLRLGGF